MKIPVLYEDNHLLVVEKPPGLLSQSDQSGDTDLLSLLKQDLKQRHNKPGEAFLGLVHRLDRPTGGVMVFARTSKAASRLSDQIRRGAITKTYFAVLDGSPPPDGPLEDYLLKDRDRNTVHVVDADIPDARAASLHFQAVAQADGKSLIRVDLITGRSHQIRVQFASRGAPLAGDHRYGHGASGEDLALWASRLSFEHPTTRETHSFASAPPDSGFWTPFRKHLERTSG